MDNVEAIRLRDRYLELAHAAEKAFEEYNQFMMAAGLRAKRISCSDDEMDLYPPATLTAPPAPAATPEMALFTPEPVVVQKPIVKPVVVQKPVVKPGARPPAKPTKKQVAPAEPTPAAAAGDPVDSKSEKELRLEAEGFVEVDRVLKRLTSKKTGEVMYAYKVSYERNGELRTIRVPVSAPDELSAAQPSCAASK